MVDVSDSGSALPLGLGISYGKAGRPAFPSLVYRCWRCLVWVRLKSNVSLSATATKYCPRSYDQGVIIGILVKNNFVSSLSLTRLSRSQLICRRPKYFLLGQ